MAMSPAPAYPPPSPLPQLFATPERLGWVFRDRNRYRRSFPESAPAPEAVPYALVESVERARRRLVPRMLLAGGVGAGLMLLAGCCAGLAGDAAALFGLVAFLGFLGGVVGVAGLALHYTNARSTLQAEKAEQHRRYVRAHADWQARQEEFDRAEQARVDRLDEWGPATPPPDTRRVDIVGGSIWGWEALLTVFGGSLLRTRGALTLVDFSGSAVCRELVRLAEETGTAVDVQRLPADLADTGLLSGLRPDQLVDTLVEAAYGDRPTGSRADRQQDTRILTALCGALDGEVSLGRLAAGLRILMGESGGLDVLSAAERARIADELFTDEFRRQAYPELRRIEAGIYPLAALGTAAGEPVRARLTCLVDEGEGRTAAGELLKDLTAQWLIRRVATGPAGLGAIVIAGADDLAHRHIERLSDLCERHGIRLVLLFRHLRDAAVPAIGGGAVGFMRLANHEEARQAAEFIGRRHTFVLSQLTRTVGGNDSHTVADTEGTSRTEGGSTSTSTGPRRSRQRGRNWSVTRNWARTVSVATGTNWSDAEATQRVYEYTVEPRVLQDLPDHALLLVNWDSGGPVLQPVECDPAIVLLPRVAAQPLPEEPLPDRSVPGTPAPAIPPGSAPDLMDGGIPYPRNKTR
jgi:hypothetical protein